MNIKKTLWIPRTSPRDDNARLLRDDNARLLRDDNARLLRDDNARLLRDDNARLVQGDNTRLIRNNNIRLAATIKAIILGLFLCQIAMVFAADGEAWHKVIKKQLTAMAKPKQSQHEAPVMSAIDYARYQKVLTQEGLLTIKLGFKKNTKALNVQIIKTADDGSSLCLLRATGKRSTDNNKNLLLSVQEQTPCVQFDTDSEKVDDRGWQLRIDDGGRNKLRAHISLSGGLTINQGQGLDSLIIKTANLLTFAGALEFAKITLEANEVINKGAFKVGALHGTVNKLVNKTDLQASEAIDLQMQILKNSGKIMTPSLALQSTNVIENNIGAELRAEQLTLSGKCTLMNQGAIISNHQLDLKISSTTNDGLLSAKDLLIIDNAGNYFKNTVNGEIQTAGILQIAATGPWWVNAGKIRVHEIRSNGVFLNLRSGNIDGQYITASNGTMHNDGMLTAKEFNAHLQSISGEGKLFTTNSQIKIDSDYVQLGQWNCLGKCAWTALKFSIAGEIVGGSDADHPAQLTITSEKNLSHSGSLACATGATCTTVSEGNTINTRTSTIINNGNTTQQATNGGAQLNGVVNGTGDFAVNASAGILNDNIIDTKGKVQLDSGENFLNSNLIKGDKVIISADKILENAFGANITSNSSTSLYGQNVEQEGRVGTAGWFKGEAEQKFTNSGEVLSALGSNITAGQEIINTESGIFYNSNGNATFIAPKVVNNGKILAKEDLEIFASQLFHNTKLVKAGDAATITADTVNNVAGRILVGQLLTIHARQLNNERAPTDYETRRKLRSATLVGAGCAVNKIKIMVLAIL